MKSMIKKLLKKILYVDYIKIMMAFHHDAKRFIAHSAALNPRGRTVLEAKIIMHYHVLEKGITMPNRRIPFGMNVAKALVSLLREFEQLYGLTRQVEHGMAVLRDYFEIHRLAGIPENDLIEISQFFDTHPTVCASKQLHFSRQRYYAMKNEPFPIFAAGRHSIRNYSSTPIDDSKIIEAVKLATTAPSACNRQHVRVRCIRKQDACRQVLELQGGNRGFGHLADKVLLVTAELQAEVGGTRERYDAYVNGGIFLMNLCYAMTYFEIAHCILTASMERETESKIRSLVNIPDSEVIVAILSCGEPSDEFDVASSPRRDADELLFFVD